MKGNYLKILIGCSIFLLFSCQKDDLVEDVHSEAQNGMIFNRINGMELKSKSPLVFAKLESLKQENNTGLFSKTVNINDEYSINTDEVIEIIKDGIANYTFSISRTEPNDTVENLVITLDTAGNLYGKIVVYNLNEQDRLDIQFKTPIDLTNKIQLKDIENINSVASQVMRTGLECITFNTIGGSICPSGEHNMTQMQNHQCSIVNSGNFTPSIETIVQMIVDADCLSGSNNGGGIVGPPNPINPGAPSSPSNPGGGSSNNNPPITTTPQLQTNRTPCDQLRNLETKTAFTSKMTTLKNNIGGTKEMGFMFIDNPNSEFSLIVEGNEKGDLEFPYQFLSETDLQKFYGTAHNHLENKPDQIGVFTPDDLSLLVLNGIIETHPNNVFKKAKPEKAIAVVITEIGLFAIKINDLNKLKSYVDKYDNIVKTNKTEEYLNEDFSHPEKYNIRPTSTHDQQINGFLRFIKDEQIGIDLYEGNKSDFGSWKKLTLQDNGDGTFSHTAEPCS